MSSSAGYSTRAGDCYVNGNLYASNIWVPNAAGTGYQDITGNLRIVQTFVDTATAGQVITGNKYFAANVTQLDQAILGSVQNYSAFSKPGRRQSEPIKIAIGQNDFFSTQIFDNALLGLPILADILHEVEVAIAVYVLLADEHGLICTIDSAILSTSI